MKPKKTYIVATRPSPLAYTQTVQVVNLLVEKNPGCDFKIIKISTQGDTITDQPLTEFEGTGVFVKELEQAILQGKADFAVNSLKDVPCVQPNGLILASFPKREDPRDVFITRDNKTIQELHDNCIIGTGSPRRIVQLMTMKPKAIFKALRGNIGTRLKKLEEGQYDAIVIAAAGLKRLGKTLTESAYLSVSSCLPAIGQGTIALECKKEDQETISLLRSINDNNTEIAVKAERSFMITIGGGCKYPLAAYAEINGVLINLSAMTGNLNPFKIHRISNQSTIINAEELGKTLAERMITEAGKMGIKMSDYK